MIIDIEGQRILDILDEKGWIQKAYTGEDGVCLHGAIRLCAPQPGDAAIIEEIARREDWGTAWNDRYNTTEEMVRARIANGVHISDEDLEDTFGSQWEGIVRVVRAVASWGSRSMENLEESWQGWWAESRWDEVWREVQDAVATEDREAAWDASGEAVWRAIVTDWGGVEDEAKRTIRNAGGNVVGALVVKDLISAESFEILVAEWVKIMGRTWEA